MDRFNIEIGLGFERLGDNFKCSVNQITITDGSQNLVFNDGVIDKETFLRFFEKPKKQEEISSETTLEEVFEEELISEIKTEEVLKEKSPSEEELSKEVQASETEMDELFGDEVQLKEIFTKEYTLDEVLKDRSEEDKTLDEIFEERIGSPTEIKDNVPTIKDDTSELQRLINLVTEYQKVGKTIPPEEMAKINYYLGR